MMKKSLPLNPTTSQPSASTSAPRAPRVKKQTFEDLCDLNEAIIMLPKEKSLHETGILDGMLPSRDRYIAQQREVASISANIQSVLTTLTLVTSLAMGATFIGCT